MPLPPPRRRDPRTVVVVAVTFGVLAVVVTAVLIGNELVRGDRPEEDVAATFLSALFDGRGGEVHQLTTPAYQRLVFASDLDRLSEVLARTAGDVSFDVLGSERTPDADPPSSYVGYQGDSDLGTVEGVLVLLEVEPGGWRVQDVSYRFPDAPAEATAELFALIESLNQQIAARASVGSS